MYAAEITRQRGEGQRRAAMAAHAVSAASLESAIEDAAFYEAGAEALATARQQLRALEIAAAVGGERLELLASGEGEVLGHPASGGSGRPAAPPTRRAEVECW